MNAQTVQKAHKEHDGMTIEFAYYKEKEHVRYA